MRKVVLFSSLMPTKDNFNGPSALPYHLMKNRPDGYELIVYTPNNNHVDIETVNSVKRDLACKIKMLEDDFYNYFHKRHTLAELRLFLHIDKSYGQSNYRLRKKDLNEINTFNPDLVIIIDENFESVARQLCHFKMVVFGYDCFPLHFNRLMRDSFCFQDVQRFKKVLNDYKIAIFRELRFDGIPCQIAEVGIEDARYYKIITKRDNAKFYPHPHYNVVDKKIDFAKSKFSIVITGKYDVYTYSDATKLLNVLSNSIRELKDKFSFTFLGRSWSEYAKTLKTLGYEIHQKNWVDSYADELVKHDIQIFPISVGSGTKGKVLDALSMGLLSIGSSIAMENIYVRSGHSCIQYSNVEDVPIILRWIFENKNLAAKMAENGRWQVLKWHDPKRVSKILFEDALGLGGKEFDGEQEFTNVTSMLKPLCAGMR